MSAEPAERSWSEWATLLGRNRRWLEQKVVQSITAYAEHHRQLVQDQPEAHAMIDKELGRALFAQLQYATQLTEHSVIGYD